MATTTTCDNCKQPIAATANPGQLAAGPWKAWHAAQMFDFCSLVCIATYVGLLQEHAARPARTLPS